MEQAKNRDLHRAKNATTATHPAPRRASQDRPRQSKGQATARTIYQPTRLRDWSGQSAVDTLARYKPGKADPLLVLNVLLRLFNNQHTAREKTVSYKTQQERADFLKRFFRDLTLRAGFKTLPDPRNLGQKHVHAMVQVWRQDKLKPPTIQTYLSFLRGLARWTKKEGFIRNPAFYGLALEEYQRHEAADRDKSWSAQGIDIEPMLDRIFAYDRFVGASLRLMSAFGLRRKESVMLRPHQCVVPFADTGVPENEKEADQYVWISQGAKNGRPRVIPLHTSERFAALELACSVAVGSDAHMGDPSHDLKHNLRRLSYVVTKFKLTAKELGATGHGLRHQVFIDKYVSETGVQPPVRGGNRPPLEVERKAMLSVARLAGHTRMRAANAYLGQSVVMRSKSPHEPDDRCS